MGVSEGEQREGGAENLVELMIENWGDYVGIRKENRP